MVPTELLNNKDLTLKAKWLFAFIQSKPDDWNFSAKRISQQTKDWIDGVNAWLQELEKAWYLRRDKYQEKGTGYWEIEYILYDEPETENPVQEKPIQEKPVTEKPVLENPSTYSKIDSSKIDNSKIEKRYFQDSKINDLFLLFIENRKQMRKKMTDIAIDRMVKKIESWIPKHGAEKVAGFIETTIENGWQGIFEKETPKKPEKLSYETTERGKFTF